MTKSVLSKNLDGKRLSFIAIFFAMLFCLSSIEIFVGEKTRRHEEQIVKEGVERLSQSSSEIAAIEMVYHSGHQPLTNGTGDRAARIAIDYGVALSTIAREFAFISRDPDQPNVIHFGARGSLITRQLNNSPDDYFYERLLLEKQRQDGVLSYDSYTQKIVQLGQEYSKTLGNSDVTTNEPGFIGELGTPEQQLAEMKAEIASLKLQLSRPERSALEKWLPIVVSILSLIIALSSHILGWRADRRASREAKQRNEIVIKPSADEINLYSRSPFKSSKRPQ